MESPAVTFTLAYVVLSVCFVFPPHEFRAAGLTVQGLLGAWLGSEDAAFVQHHLRRSTGTLLAHALLPLGAPRAGTGREGPGAAEGGSTWALVSQCCKLMPRHYDSRGSKYPPSSVVGPGQ